MARKGTRSWTNSRNARGPKCGLINLRFVSRCRRFKSRGMTKSGTYLPVVSIDSRCGKGHHSPGRPSSSSVSSLSPLTVFHPYFPLKQGVSPRSPPKNQATSSSFWTFNRSDRAASDRESPPPIHRKCRDSRICGSSWPAQRLKS